MKQKKIPDFVLERATADAWIPEHDVLPNSGVGNHDIASKNWWWTNFRIRKAIDTLRQSLERELDAGRIPKKVTKSQIISSAGIAKGQLHHWRRKAWVNEAISSINVGYLSYINKQKDKTDKLRAELAFYKERCNKLNIEILKLQIEAMSNKKEISSLHEIVINKSKIISELILITGQDQVDPKLKILFPNSPPSSIE